MLHTNGGKLELIKCFWVLIIWKWINGIPKLEKVNDTNATLKIVQSENGEQVEIRQIETDEAPRVLR